MIIFLLPHTFLVQAALICTDRRKKTRNYLDHSLHTNSSPQLAPTPATYTPVHRSFDQYHSDKQPKPPPPAWPSCTIGGGWKRDA